MSTTHINCEFFEVHGSKLKLEPFSDSNQASILSISHCVLLFGICKCSPLSGLFRHTEKSESHGSPFEIYTFTYLTYKPGFYHSANGGFQRFVPQFFHYRQFAPFDEVQLFFRIY